MEVSWKPSLRIGHDLIDSQHVELFRLFDEFIAGSAKGTGKDALLELHQALQKDLGYDANQLASFFITNEMWEKQKEITLIDMMQDPKLGTTTMDQVTLEEFLTEINHRMIYVYDFFAERAFFIEQW